MGEVHFRPGLRLYMQKPMSGFSSNSIHGAHVMPILSNPKLKITSTAGSGQLKITTSVTVRFSAAEENIIKANSLTFKLKSRVWGEDDGFNGGNDPLFWLATKTITKGGDYQFVRTVHHGLLDEDSVGEDEVFAKFFLQAVAFPMMASTRSPTQSGDY